MTSHKDKSPRLTTDIDIRSEKVRQILGEIPRSLTLWSAVTLIAVMLILFFVLCFIPLPASNGLP